MWTMVVIRIYDYTVGHEMKYYALLTLCVDTKDCIKRWTMPHHFLQLYKSDAKISGTWVLPSCLFLPIQPSAQSRAGLNYQCWRFILFYSIKKLIVTWSKCHYWNGQVLHFPRLSVFILLRLLFTEKFYKLRLKPRCRPPTQPILGRESTVWGSASAKWRARYRVLAPRHCPKRWRANIALRWQHHRSKNIKIRTDCCRL